MYYVIKRAKQFGAEATTEFVCPDTEEKKFEDAVVLAEVMAAEHARHISVDAPTPISEGVYEFTTSNGTLITYLVQKKWGT